MTMKNTSLVCCWLWLPLLGHLSLWQKCQNGHKFTPWIKLLNKTLGVHWHFSLLSLDGFLLISIPKVGYTINAFSNSSVITMKVFFMIIANPVNIIYNTWHDFLLLLKFGLAALTHWGWVARICISKQCHHWFRQWLVTWSVPSHYLPQWWNIVNWTLWNKLQLKWNSYNFI